MTCPVCRQPAAECRCAAPLLPPMPEWRYELQQRVDAYRARRQRPLPVYRGAGAAVVQMGAPWERPSGVAGAGGAEAGAAAQAPGTAGPPPRREVREAGGGAAWTVVSEGNLARLQTAPVAVAAPVTALGPRWAAAPGPRDAACLQLP
ncbi:MAG: hypothetical protein ACRD01_05445, partial [Terriglobales bacterium]